MCLGLARGWSVFICFWVTSSRRCLRRSSGSLLTTMVTSSLAPRDDALSTDDSRSMTSVLCSAPTADWFDDEVVPTFTGALVCPAAWSGDGPLGEARRTVRQENHGFGLPETHCEDRKPWCPDNGLRDAYVCVWAISRVCYCEEVTKWVIYASAPGKQCNKAPLPTPPAASVPPSSARVSFFEP
jgi:hypothetical protein